MKTDSRKALHTAAVHNRWDVRLLGGPFTLSRPGVAITVYFNDANGRVRAAYFQTTENQHPERILGGVPAIVAELKRFGG